MSTTIKPEIKGVILDYGEVLCFRPGKEQLLRMANALGISPAEFAKLYEKNRLAYDRGDLTAEQYWFSFADEPGISVRAEEIPLLRAWDCELWSDLNPVMIKWLESIHLDGLRTALLSNMQEDMVIKVRRDSHWIKHIDFAVFSYEVRLAKPEAKIYEYCLQGLGTEPHETLFIDDREVNVKAAQALGIRAILFKSAAQLQSELEGFNLPLISSDPTALAG
jgi:putative hydrolase of the HAD superfamily